MSPLSEYLGKSQSFPVNTRVLAKMRPHSHHANVSQLSDNEENQTPQSQPVQARATAVQKSTVQTREDRPLASEADAITRTFGQLYEGQQLGKSECSDKA